MAPVSIPVVDLAAVIDKKIEDCDREVLTSIAGKIVDIFTTVGFVYIKNGGVTSELLADMYEYGEKFRTLPHDVKLKYIKPPNGELHGWLPMLAESNDPDRPLGDLKESYNATPSHANLWPDEDVPGFKQVTLDFFKSCEELGYRLFYLLGLGLGLEDPNYFVTNHPAASTGIKTYSAVKTLYYPPLPDDVKPGQVRLGEHTDYGSMTLLFQDAIGGLEARCTDGSYVAATPIPGTILINLGGLMQRWTADRLKATPHRVLIPEEEIRQRSPRRSIAFFIHPADECVVSPIDGSNKYPPITARQYTLDKIGASIKK